jgi:murein DD-endopeptidase MepM/ murein hydrolase activator NlpD
MPIALAKIAGGAAVLVAVAIAASASGTPAAPPLKAEPLAARPPAPQQPQAAPEPEPAGGPVRLTGLAGTNLNLAMAQDGVPGAAAQDYLRALAGRIRLADGISVADRFDLIIAEGQLLYAGLDRVGASDVQLMRWAVDGRTGWVDATGADVAEAMKMPVNGRISSGFGTRYHPVLHAMRMHKGVDMAAAAGTPIRASADGRITFAGWAGGYGRQVRIGHGEGLATSYSHMSRIAAAPGQAVHRGEVIGFVGSSGLSTGPHLHYEVFKNGRPVNPMTVRTVGGATLDKQERRDFNDRLRSLLTGRMG